MAMTVTKQTFWMTLKLKKMGMGIRKGKGHKVVRQNHLLMFQGLLALKIHHVVLLRLIRVNKRSSHY
jgi:hypothetical protein